MELGFWDGWMDGWIEWAGGYEGRHAQLSHVMIFLDVCHFFSFIAHTLS